MRQLPWGLLLYLDTTPDGLHFFQGLLPSEWVNLGESCPERLAGEEVGGFSTVGKVARLS